MSKTPRVLCCDGIADRGIEILREVAEVDVEPKGLTAARLRERIAPYDALVVRSATIVDAAAIEAAPKLRAIARAGVGVDNIDLSAATARGIIVINSPEGNTVSAAEHTMALLLALARKIPAADALLRQGEWSRKEFVGRQLYRKTLGVVGCGKIGSEVVRRAQAFGMDVLVHDPYLSQARAEALGARLVPLDELLREAHFVSIHAPKTTGTMELIGRRELALMRHGAGLINCARGGLVDEEALVEALREGRLGGAALDVFAAEPEPPSHLAPFPNVVLTPHLGASTEEAQEFVAVDVAEQIADILEGKLARSAVNAPAIPPEALRELAPYLNLAERIGRLHSHLLAGPIETVELLYAGDIAERDTQPLGLWFLMGLLSPLRSYPVNIVNAPVEAESWGIRLSEGTGTSTRGYASLVAARVGAGGQTREVSGTVFGAQDARIVEMDGHRIDLAPRGTVLFIWHHDRPGVIGRVGTLMGDRGVNIAGMQVGRTSVGGPAVMALMLDNPIDEQTLQDVRSSPDLTNAMVVNFD
ncbi:MAG: phosphoglycerate dehydrogenase [Armatimonadetes bacterium]|nr:phosphoglycerate dehydrogenase [Armatimonadota bacterium]